MRRINSDFRTKFISEEGQKLANRDYFGYVEMDDFACYVLADSLDGETAADSAQVVVESIIRSFGEGPTLSRRRLNRYIQEAHRELRSMRGGMHLKASVVLAVTDYRSMRCCHVGNCRLYLLRNSRFLLKTRDQSLPGICWMRGKSPWTRRRPTRSATTSIPTWGEERGRSRLSPRSCGWKTGIF